MSSALERARRYAGHAGAIAVAMGRYALARRRDGLAKGGRALGHLVRELASVARRQGGACECPICGWTGPRFGPIYYFDQYREDIRCYGCGATDRDRLVKLYVRDRLGPFFAAPGRRVLDIGPLAYSRGFFPETADYVSFDLVSDHAMVKGDLCAAPFPDASFDLWLCFHVLDLIPDDAAAMRELFRVLRPGGVGLLDHVMHGDRPTEEYGAPRASECGHLRRYGTDLVDRLETIGFAVEIADTVEVFDADTRRRFGIHPRRVMLCKKRDAAARARAS